jgi:hypothetical protein
MQVTFTNASADPIYLSQLYVEIAPGASVTTQRTRADLEGDQILKAYVQAGTITLAFTLETGDSAPAGFGSVPMSYTNITRPAANTVPTFTAIWNTDDEALNWSDGTDWRMADGSIT